MSNAGTPPPAGWYPDPHNPYLRRWWNGNAWTEDANPPQPVPPPSGSLHSGEHDRVARKNSAAVWGFVLSLVSIPVFPFSPILAVLGAAGAVTLGSIGLARAKSYGAGFGLALTAVIIGGIQGLGGVIVLLFAYGVG